MKVYFWRSANKRILRCRRGKNIYRPLEIPANVDVAEYNPLTNSILELVDQSMVIGVAEVDTAIDPKIMLQSTDKLAEVIESVLDPDPEPKNDLENQLEEDDVEPSSEESTNDQISDESPSKSEDTMQRMVHESVDNAGAISGAVEVQVSSVAKRDDGLDDSSEYRPEVSSGRLYGGDDGMDSAQDRPGEAVDPISSSDESPSSD